MVVGALAVIFGFLGVILCPSAVPYAELPSENAEMSAPSSAAVLYTSPDTRL